MAQITSLSVYGVPGPIQTFVPKAQDVGGDAFIAFCEATATPVFTTEASASPEFYCESTPATAAFSAD